MPIYGGTTERPWTLNRIPALPDLPSAEPEILNWIQAFDRAMADSIASVSRLVQAYVELSGLAAFGAAVTTLAIAFETPTADANYGVALTPSWNAATWYTGLATTGFTINASAAPGGGGGTVTWAVVR